MSDYNFRTTTKINNDLYIEDRGYEYRVERGSKDFPYVDEKFGNMLVAGQTAVRDFSGDDEDRFTVIDEFPMLEHAKAAKLVEINERCQVALSQITNLYPQGETLTFDQQKEEALQFLADNTAPCPMLRALAQYRGIEMQDLAERVLRKANAFSAISGALMGQRQAYEDRLDKCTLPSETAFAVTYELPSE